jgi:putative flavoprotein involved in K+ transport
MDQRTETVVIGAGQAGLAISHCLTDLGREHVVLERGGVAQRWRDQRWDSFRLLTPNWHTRLPGHRYRGLDPDGFMSGAEVVAMFEGYAHAFGAPLHVGTTVRRVAPTPAGWRVSSDRGVWMSRNVVVATGPHDVPRIPRLSRQLPPEILQLHASAYRSPATLPDGGVLVVGAGPTGQQLAGELARSGRRVTLAVGRHQRLPRTYRGRDAFWWLDRTGALEETVDERAEVTDPRHPVHPVLAGGRELGLQELVEDGVVPVGRLRGTDGCRVHLGDDLLKDFLEAERAAARFEAAADAHVLRIGLPAPEVAPRPPLRVPEWARQPARSIDLRAAGFRTVVWATGYGRNYRWLDAPVFDADGEPIHRRGVTAAPGLFFLGLTWLYRRKSASIDGVGDDAIHLAETIATDVRLRATA